MAARRGLLLLINGLILTASLTLAPAWAQDSDDEPVIEPEVERTDARRAAIDTENFEAGAYAGVLSIEDFGSNLVYGGRLAYHINEFFFLEGAYGRSKAGQSSFEDFFGGAVQLLTDEDRRYSYYNVALGVNVLPGESYFGGDWAFTSAFYFIGGVGSTTFGGDEHFTTTIGAGYRVLLNDWLAAHVDGRDHIFARDLYGEDKNTHNLEFTTGLTVFF